MLLGIDLGTGSAKALLLEIDGNVLAESSSPYSVRASQPGWAETEPMDWWAAVAIAVRAVVADRADQVQAIGLSGQMHGVVLADGNGNALRPAILWADTRSSKVLNLYRSLPPTFKNVLANPVAAGMAGPSLLWLRVYEPEIYTTACWALQPKDWLRFCLTGEVATEPSDASGTLLYDVLADRWALDALSALNLRSDWLPPLLPSGKIAGYLNASAADHLGLPIGLPVIAGAADTAAAALGSGLLETGSAQLTVGSGHKFCPYAQIQQLILRSHPSVSIGHSPAMVYPCSYPECWTGAGMGSKSFGVELAAGVCRRIFRSNRL